MAYNSGPRVGFVRIQKDSLRVQGLDVLGRGIGGSMARRQVFVDPNAPQWFLDFAHQYADTLTRVRVQVSRLAGFTTAYVVPCAESLEELNAQPGVHVQYGIAREAVEGVKYEKAFAFHHELAEKEGLVLVEHVRAGKACYSIYENPRTHARFKISGGYFASIAAEQHRDEPAKIEADKRHLLRMAVFKDYKAE